MTRQYAPWMDWMKCVGMVLILYGHLAGWAPLASLPPIYTKQLGVAFFLFICGYSLSEETRAPWRVAFNRLFEPFLFGIATALVITVTAIAVNDSPRLSNFYPFLGGLNVVFNNFPANPTTWYLGTYLHIILLWTTLVRRVRVTPAVLVASVIGEILVRALLMDRAGLWIAYMLVPNWSTVFLLGCWHQQRGTRPVHAGRSLALLLTGIAGWSIATSYIAFKPTIIFLTLEGHSGLIDALTVSVMVSAIYVGATLLMYRTVASLPAPWPVRFVAQNTLIIFLVHMPVFYVLQPIVRQWPIDRFGRSVFYMAVCLPGLALFSEGVRRLVRPRELRDRVVSVFESALSRDQNLYATDKTSV